MLVISALAVLCIIIGLLPPNDADRGRNTGTRPAASFTPVPVPTTPIMPAPASPAVPMVADSALPGQVDISQDKQQQADQHNSSSSDHAIAVSPDSSAPPSLPSARLTGLSGSLARRREYDLWLIRNVSRIMNSESRQEKASSYCFMILTGIESLDSAPEAEYTLRSDGTVLRTTPEKPPITPEQQFRGGQRGQAIMGAIDECAGSLYWLGTWHNQPTPSDEKLMDNATKAKADLHEIDETLDPRLVESLPKPSPPQKEPAATQPPCIPYGQRGVKITGYAHPQLFAGRPDNQGPPDAVQPEAAWILEPSLDSLCGVSGPGQTARREESIRRIELLLSRQQMLAYRAMAQTMVTVTGTLLHAVDNHHFAPLIMRVDNIDPAARR